MKKGACPAVSNHPVFPSSANQVGGQAARRTGVDIAEILRHDLLSIQIFFNHIGKKLSRRMALGRIKIEHALEGKRKRDRRATSELQSHVNLVCRLLLEKKKKHISIFTASATS